MSKQVVMVLMILLAATACAFLSGCTTAQTRRQDQRIEELERRVAKIEFDSNDSFSSSSDGDFSRFRDMAKAAR